MKNSHEKNCFTISFKVSQWLEVDKFGIRSRRKWPPEEKSAGLFTFHTVFLDLSLDLHLETVQRTADHNGS